MSRKETPTESPRYVYVEALAAMETASDIRDFLSFEVANVQRNQALYRYVQVQDNRLARAHGSSTAQFYNEGILAGHGAMRMHTKEAFVPLSEQDILLYAAIDSQLRTQHGSDTPEYFAACEAAVGKQFPGLSSALEGIGRRLSSGYTEREMSAFMSGVYTVALAYRIRLFPGR